MGLFRKSTEEAMDQAEKIAKGKGLTGRLAKGFMGAENMERLQGGLDSARSSQMAQQMAASGAPTVRAQVTALSDTGQLINYDPVVMLSATLPDGTAVQLQATVSKIQIPRVGDHVLLMDNPGQPGTYLYAGLSV